MIYLEIGLSFLIGLSVILIIGFVFSLKTKGLTRLALNSVVGAIMLIILSVTGFLALPVSPLNALIVGALGLPGLFMLYILVVFL